MSDSEQYSLTLERTPHGWEATVLTPIDVGMAAFLHARPTLDGATAAGVDALARIVTEITDRTRH
uniref:hypothetical protein n=1 Tax=Amycolatopsis sp. CA-290885 TaxID=3239925 RepID=UPI003F49362A